MNRFVLLAVVAAPVVATADSTERQSFVSVMGGYSLAATPEASDWSEFTHGPLVGLSLAWDRAPPEYVRVRGERVGRAELVPEAMVQVTGREGTLLGGVRFQVALTEYQVGLFQTSSRGKLWLAPRVGAGTQANGLVVGGDFGFAFHTSGIEIGGWMGVYSWTTDDMTKLTSDFDGDGRILQVQAGLLLSSSDL